MAEKQETFIARVQPDLGLDMGSDYNRARFRMWLKRYIGKQVAIEIYPVRGTRSLKQNAYYWGAIVPNFAKHYNLSIDDAHELLKKEFNYKLVRYGEEYVQIPRSTATLKVGEFVEYVMRIKQYCDENGIYIPTDDDYDPAPLIKQSNA